MDHKHIEKKAYELTKVYSEPPIPVCEVVQNAGLSLYVVDFKKNSDFLSGFCDFEKSRILLNQEDPPMRQYFVAAHEFGHWVLHKGKYEENSDQNKYAFSPKQGLIVGNLSENIMEKEADYFAESLIMPRRMVKQFKSLYSVHELANMFNVQISLMEKRLRSV